MRRANMSAADAAWFYRTKKGQPLARAGDQAGQRKTSKVAAMKSAANRPYGDPEAAARKPIEIANSVEAVQDGRIHIELLNGPMLFELNATPAEYSAGLKLGIGRGWLVMHESGT
jgi:hypothetical protein